MQESKPARGEQSPTDRAGHVGAGDGGGGKRSPLRYWAVMAGSLLAGIGITVLYQNFKTADSKLAAAGGEPKNTDSRPDRTAPMEIIAPGTTLEMLPVGVQDVPDESSTRHLILHIPIKLRPQASVEVRDLVIHVLFYDIVDGQTVVQTSGEVNSRWKSPPADWKDGDTEELEVEYRLPKPEAKAAKRENRKYLGYIVRLYYKQQLQAATADPVRLSQEHPPQRTLSKTLDQ